MRKRGGGDGDGIVEGSRLVVNEGMLEEVEQFCYLGDVRYLKQEWREQCQQE